MRYLKAILNKGRIKGIVFLGGSVNHIIGRFQRNGLTLVKSKSVFNGNRFGKIHYAVLVKQSMEYGSLNTTELVMKREWLDTSDFEAETGFRPQIGFSQSIANMKEWLENEQEYYQNKWTFIR